MRKKKRKYKHIPGRCNCTSHLVGCLTYMIVPLYPLGMKQVVSGSKHDILVNPRASLKSCTFWHNCKSVTNCSRHTELKMKATEYILTTEHCNVQLTLIARFNAPVAQRLRHWQCFLWVPQGKFHHPLGKSYWRRCSWHSWNEFLCVFSYKVRHAIGRGLGVGECNEQHGYAWFKEKKVCLRLDNDTQGWMDCKNTCSSEEWDTCQLWELWRGQYSDKSTCSMSVW